MAIHFRADDLRRGLPRFQQMISHASAGRPRLRIGIINIMPQAELYESMLLGPLARAFFEVEVVWIRLRSHSYSSSLQDFILENYVSFHEAIRSQPLDGLILTGAPVEELEFEEVHYWAELTTILEVAARRISGTLGICWGGMALAGLMGFQKQLFDKKLFGVYPHRNLTPAQSVMADENDVFWCPESRHSGFLDAELEDGERRGLIKLLAHAPETGYTCFESHDQRFLMHLGHERDVKLGRRDVEAPHGLDLQHPEHSWRSHQSQFFSKWLERLWLRRLE
jgi:homoserine O-succinyltransferase